MTSQREVQHGHRRGVRYRFNKARLVQHFKGRCLDCNQAYPPCVFVFDHTRPLAKEDTWAVRFRVALRQGEWSEILACVADCEMVCANCHAIRTFLLRDHGSWQKAVAARKNAERAERYDDNGPASAYADETIDFKECAP